MMNPQWCRVMAAYNAEMNRRIYAAADTLTPQQREADRGAFFGSIQGTLSHLLWGDTMWMSRFAGWQKPGCGIADSPSLHPDWDALKEARRDADARIEAWAAQLDPAWLGGTLRWFSAGTGREMTQATGLLVTHFFNHQTHHRGQVHALLTGFGVATADTDLPFILDTAILTAG